MTKTRTFRSACMVVCGLGLSIAGSPRATLAAPEASAAAARPLMEITATEKDGGVVEQGTPISYRFTVRNRGQADLEIPKVQPSCGCSVVKWDHLVKPGARSVIEAQLHTETFHGRVSKYLTVISNDPDHARVELTMTAQVDPLVRVKPGTMGELSVDRRPVSREFTLERNGGRPMQIVQVLPGAPYVTAQATPLAGEGRFQVKVTAAPDAPLGRSSVPVTVVTDQEYARRITLLVVINKGIVTEPPALYFGILPSELKAPVRTAVTLSRRSSPFHIKSVSVEDPQVTPLLETVRDGSEYRVTLTYTGGWIPGTKQTLLTVLTDDPAQPTLRIPVQAVIQAGPARLPPVATH
jgi:hypothetical protein